MSDGRKYFINRGYFVFGDLWNIAIIYLTPDNVISRESCVNKMEHWRRNRPLYSLGSHIFCQGEIFSEIFLLPWRRTAALLWSWEAYEGRDEECDDDDGDEHDDEVEVVDDEFPGKAEAEAPVTVWGFGAASETTIKRREKKNATEDWLFFVPIMSTLFVYLSTCHVPPISFLFKQAHLVSQLRYRWMIYFSWTAI